MYRDAYNLVYDMARKAEYAYRFECDDDTYTYVAGDNWQPDHAGLLARESLLLQLQKMERAYIDRHKRDYEITQSFSLALLDPGELIRLRQEGNCEFMIPEMMFDLFYPGQYKRLIKSVRVTIPSVAGPYTNVSAKLSLSESKVRREPSVNAQLINIPMPRLPASAPIATSNAQNDSGTFELNFRDERYLPFEGAGAISKWRLDLPSKICPWIS